MADWTDKLSCTGRNRDKPLPVLMNAVVALRYHPAMSGVLAYNDFSMTTMLLRAPPWTSEEFFEGERPWTPEDDLHCCDWLQQLSIMVSVAVTSDAVELAAHDRHYHPVVCYLGSCRQQWDGTPRVHNLLADYFGAEPSPYHTAVSSCLMIGAVARALQPGCKNDCMVILEGKQGLLKSTALKELFSPWFTDELSDFGSKDAALQVRGVWCIEVSELDAMSRGDVAKVKAFMSRTEDRFRPVYARRVIESPRSCIFVGTTNSEGYLKDETGNRRYLPAKVADTGPIRIGDLRRDRHQLWAEAVALFEAGHKWWLTGDDILDAAAKVADDRYVGDPWDGPISEYLDSLLYNREIGGLQVDLAQLLGVYCLNLPKSQWGQPEMNRIARVLKRLGWERKQIRDGEKRHWVYRKLMPHPCSEEMPDNVTPLHPAPTETGDEQVTGKKL